MALNPFAFGTPLSSFGSQQVPFVPVAQQPLQQIAQLLQIVAQQQQQLLQIGHVQQHQLQYLQQIVQTLPAQVAQLQQSTPQYFQQSQQPFGQIAGGAGFQGISPWAASPLSGIQANYVM
jgi:hypothetical protein